MRDSWADIAGEKVGSLRGGRGGGVEVEEVCCSEAMRARAAERASGEGSGSMSGERCLC